MSSPTHDHRPALSTRRVVAAVVALALGGFAIGTTEFVTMGLLPDIADGVGVDIPSGGHLISAYALGVVVGGPVIAALGARLPRRGLLVGLMAAFLIGNALTAVAPGYRTLLVARFLSGLPHGAFFGVASLVAASLVAPHLRGRAVSSVLLGLAAAMLTGVPAATWMGQQLGWRSAYWAVAVLAAITVTAVLALVPSSPGRAEATVRGELGALRRPQVILTLSVGIVGFGGMFALYSYIAPLSTEVTGLSRGTVPLVLLVYGAGGIVGTALGGRLADWALFRSLVGSLVVLFVLLGLVALTSPWAPALFVGVFLVSIAASALAVLLQMRLMETAGDAQMLGASLNHSSLNLANALGAWIGGLVIAAGLGYQAPAAVGAALAVAGLIPLAASAVVRRRTLRASADVPAGQERRRAARAGARRLTPRPLLQRGCNVAAPPRPRTQTSRLPPWIRGNLVLLAPQSRIASLPCAPGKPGLSSTVRDRLRLYSGSDRGHTSERRSRDPDQRAGRWCVVHRRRRAADASRPLPARAVGQGRHRRRVRHQQLRRVHRAPRRRGREELHRLRRPGRRQRGHHHRGDRPRGRRPAPDAEGLPRDARPAVRVLHARG